MKLFFFQTWKQQINYDNCLAKALCLNPSAVSDCLDSVLSDYKAATAAAAAAGKSTETIKLNPKGQLFTKLRHHQDFVSLFEQNPHLLSKCKRLKEIWIKCYPVLIV